jgi:hypothetical protein
VNKKCEKERRGEKTKKERKRRDGMREKEWEGLESGEENEKKLEREGKKPKERRRYDMDGIWIGYFVCLSQWGGGGVF